MLGKKKSLLFRSYSELGELIMIMVPHSITFSGPYLERTSSLSLSVSLLLEHDIVLFLLLSIQNKPPPADATFEQNSTEQCILCICAYIIHTISELNKPLCIDQTAKLALVSCLRKSQKTKSQPHRNLKDYLLYFFRQIKVSIWCTAYVEK